MNTLRGPTEWRAYVRVDEALNIVLELDARSYDEFVMALGFRPQAMGQLTLGNEVIVKPRLDTCCKVCTRRSGLTKGLRDGDRHEKHRARAAGKSEVDDQLAGGLLPEDLDTCGTCGDDECR